MTEAQWLDCTDPMGMVAFVRGKVTDRKIRLFGCACCRRIWHLFPGERCQQAVQYAEKYADGLIGEPERREVGKSALAAYVCSAAAAEVALPGTWDPLDCLATEHDRSEYEDMYAQACEEARRMPCDASEAWVSREAAHAAYGALLVDQDPPLMHFVCCHAASAVTFFYEHDGWEAYCSRGDAAEMAAQRRIFDDIIGNPFRPISIDSAWHTPTVVAHAHTAYDNRTLPAGTLDPARLAVLADALEEAGCTNADMLTHCRGPGLHYRGCWLIDALLGKCKTR